MKRNQIFELLTSPCTPYLIVELIYLIISIIFNLKLRHLNELLNQTFDINKMVLQKDVMIAGEVMTLDNNVSVNFLIGGIVLIIIAFIIPIVSSIINKSSYKEDEVKVMIWLVICLMVVINIIIIMLISKALFSPIIIATLILCIVGSIFAMGGASQS